ncbi:MAG: permease-like cell division protein FtsX [Desulfobulbaceae bacterium]|jgi:cell division transport system permease protein|nr:permease-like cell division protein FtsX [Desulfobulbaceae bacterium]
MKFWLAVLQQLGRNLRQTWPSQMMTFLTVSLSVLIFSLFSVIYINMLTVSRQIGDDLQLVVYLNDEPGPEMQEQLRNKITAFDQVESIHFVSRDEAYQRFRQQLGDSSDVLDDMPHDFLPPSIEVTPLHSLRGLSQIKLFSDYLLKLPGAEKVQYGQEWIERFHSFTQVLRLVVLLSASLLILTTIFMVSHTIRLTIMGRVDELELLKLVGATNNYIRMPFMLEGFLQGLAGSLIGLSALYALFLWISHRVTGSELLSMVHFTFFQPGIIALIILLSIILCTAGSYFSMHKYLRF